MPRWYWGVGIDASCPSHGGGGGTDFRDKSTTVGSTSSGINAAKQLKSAPLKTEPHNSCEPASFRKIYNGSHTSGDLRDKGTLIANKEGNSSIVGSTKDL